MVFRICVVVFYCSSKAYGERDWIIDTSDKLFTIYKI